MRRTFRTAGAPARALFTGLIRVYRVTLSGWFGGQCRFYPTCSHYAEEAIQVHGALKGSGLTLWRVLRCHPFGHGGIDAVPATKLYETVIPNPSERAV